jgi:hypothetical protein
MSFQLFGQFFGFWGFFDLPNVTLYLSRFEGQGKEGRANLLFYDLLKYELN